MAMKKSSLPIVGLVICIVLGNWTGAAKAADDANLAWDASLMALPGGIRTSLQRVQLNNGWATFLKPTTTIVLYLHGSNGIQDKGVVPHDGYQIANRMDAVVFAPDSFARKGRISNGDSSGRGTGNFSQATNYRLQEIAYSLQQIAKIPGVNMTKLVLMGHSEGGKAAANWPGHEFRAIIMTGWNCSTKDTGYSGTKIPTDVPVMNIVGTRDEILISNPAKSCANVLTNHSVKEVINPDSKEHWLNNKYYPEIISFIKANTR